MRAEGAVDLLLDGAHGEHALSVADHPIPIELRVEHGIRLEAHHHVQPQRQRAFGGHALVAVDGGEARSRVVKGRHTLGERIGASQLHHLAEARIALGRRGLRQLVQSAPHETLR